MLLQLEHEADAQPLNLRQKLRAIVDNWFRESEICQPLKKVGTAIQQIQSDRAKIYSEHRGRITQQMTALQKEGPEIANTKREASVERVLKTVSEKMDMINSLREGLRDMGRTASR